MLYCLCHFSLLFRLYYWNTLNLGVASLSASEANGPRHKHLRELPRQPEPGRLLVTSREFKSDVLRATHSLCGRSFTKGLGQMHFGEIILERTDSTQCTQK